VELYKKIKNKKKLIKLIKFLFLFLKKRGSSPWGWPNHPYPMAKKKKKCLMGFGHGVVRPPPGQPANFFLFFLFIYFSAMGWLNHLPTLFFSIFFI
jgi:hypothetical protein